MPHLLKWICLIFMFSFQEASADTTDDISTGLFKDPSSSFNSEKEFECPKDSYEEYTIGCSNEFITCRGGVAKKSKCFLPTMRFSRKLNMCNLPEDIPECYGIEPKDQVEPVKTTKSDFDCSNMENGNNELGSCSSSYVQCLEGRTIEHVCPGRKVYSVGIGRCDWQINVAGCPGSHTQTVVSPLTGLLVPIYTRPVQGLAASQAETPKIKPKFKCSADGFESYNIGCSNKYIMCISGVATKFECYPPAARYSRKLMMCNLPENVPECAEEVHGSSSSI